MAKRIAARLVHAVDTLFVVAAVALAVALLLPRLFGYTPYAVLSGSMEPELPVGSMVYVHETDPATLHPGDVVTFYRSDGAVVTHQVYEVDADACTIGTQGIANKDADGSLVHDAQATPFSGVIGIAAFCIPYLGYVEAFCTTPSGLLAIIAVLALLAVASLLLGKSGSCRAGRRARGCGNDGR